MRKRYRYGKVDFSTPKSKIAGSVYFLIAWLVGGYTMSRYLFRPDKNKSAEENARDYRILRFNFNKRLFGLGKEGEEEYRHIKVKNFRIVKDSEDEENSELKKE